MKHCLRFFSAYCIPTPNLCEWNGGKFNAHFFATVRRALDKDEYNHITATYFLLAERRLKVTRQEQAQAQRVLSPQSHGHNTTIQITSDAVDGPEPRNNNSLLLPPATGQYNSSRLAPTDATTTTTVSSVGDAVRGALVSAKLTKRNFTFSVCSRADRPNAQVQHRPRGGPGRGRGGQRARRQLAESARFAFRGPHQHHRSGSAGRK